MTGLEMRVHVAAEELTAAVHAGDPDEARRVVDRHHEILDYVAALLASRIPPAEQPADAYAARRHRVQQVKLMEANGVPPKVIAARAARWHLERKAGAA